MHQQLEDLLKERISNDEWSPNTQIPSEKELGELYGLSRMTTRTAISRLVAQGVLKRVPGKGTYVAASKIDNTPAIPHGTKWQLDAQGVPSQASLLSLTKVPAPKKVARELKLEYGAYVWRLERLRSVNDEPLSIHLLYLPVSLCPDVDKRLPLDCEVREILNHDYGLTPHGVAETVETVIASEQEADLLGVPDGFALILLEETTWGISGQPYAFSHVLIRGDKMKLRFSSFHYAQATTTTPTATT